MKPRVIVRRTASGLYYAARVTGPNSAPLEIERGPLVDKLAEAEEHVKNKRRFGAWQRS